MTDKMPDKIWVTGQAEPWTFDYGTWNECEVVDSGETEYTRTALVDELIAVAKLLADTTAYEGDDRVIIDRAYKAIAAIQDKESTLKPIDEEGVGDNDGFFEMTVPAQDKDN